MKHARSTVAADSGFTQKHYQVFSLSVLISLSDMEPTTKHETSVYLCMNFPRPDNKYEMECGGFDENSKKKVLFKFRTGVEGETPTLVLYKNQGHLGFIHFSS